MAAKILDLLDALYVWSDTVKHKERKVSDIARMEVSPYLYTQNDPMLASQHLRAQNSLLEEAERAVKDAASELITIADDFKPILEYSLNAMADQQRETREHVAKEMEKGRGKFLEIEGDEIEGTNNDSATQDGPTDAEKVRAIYRERETQKRRYLDSWEHVVIEDFAEGSD